MQTQHEMTMSFYNEFGDLNVYAKQYDTRRFIQFEFTEEVIPEDTSNFYAFIRGKYADGSLIPITFINKVYAKEGYYYEEQFYIDAEHTIKIDGNTSLIYEDLPSGKYYRWKEIKNTTSIDPIVSIHTSITPVVSLSSGIYIEIPNPIEDNEVTEDYILFRIPSTLLEISGKTVCDLVLCESPTIPHVEPDGTIDPNDEMQILSTHTFNIFVEPMATSGESISQHTKDDAAELTRLIIAAQEIVYSGQEYLGQTKSYAVGDEVARPGSSTDNAKYYYQQSKDAVYGKGVMDLHINEDGHLIYQRSDDLDNVSFSIHDNKDLILEVS